MSTGPTWKLQKEDTTIDEFIDVRRKVGNQIIREYLLDNVANDNSIIRVSGRLRGPKNEFKDFAKFLILQVNIGGSTERFLAETGVYENLRIVAVDSTKLANRDSKDLLNIFTEALENPEKYNTTLILSDDSEVR
jgi:hypothetical protein